MVLWRHQPVSKTCSSLCESGRHDIAVRDAVPRHSRHTSLIEIYASSGKSSRLSDKNEVSYASHILEVNNRDTTYPDIRSLQFSSAFSDGTLEQGFAHEKSQWFSDQGYVHRELGMYSISIDDVLYVIIIVRCHKYLA